MISAAEIKELIKLNGWRDEEAASECGVSLRTIYNWKRKGCSRKGEAKRLLKRLEASRNREAKAC